MQGSASHHSKDVYCRTQAYIKDLLSSRSDATFIHRVSLAATRSPVRPVGASPLPNLAIVYRRHLQREGIGLLFARFSTLDINSPMLVITLSLPASKRNTTALLCGKNSREWYVTRRVCTGKNPKPPTKKQLTVEEIYKTLIAISYIIK